MKLGFSAQIEYNAFKPCHFRVTFESDNNSAVRTLTYPTLSLCHAVMPYFYNIFPFFYFYFTE